MADKPDVDFERARRWCDENGVLPHHKDSLAYLLRAVRLETLKEFGGHDNGPADKCKTCHLIAALEAK